MIAGLIHDLRFATRQLRKNPAFALTAIVVLTLGIVGKMITPDGDTDQIPSQRNGNGLIMGQLLTKGLR